MVRSNILNTFVTHYSYYHNHLTLCFEKFYEEKVEVE